MKTTHFTKFLIAVLIAAFAAVCFAQVTQKAPNILPSIKKLMTHDEFTKAGLGKLSEEEVKVLDEWLQKFALDVAKAVVAKSGAEAGDVIETQIDGTFEGWDGETIGKMTNGQVWQQAAYAYHYHYAFRPKVTIFKSSSGYKMKVDGVSQEVTVKRVK